MAEIVAPPTVSHVHSLLLAGSVPGNAKTRVIRGL